MWGADSQADGKTGDLWTMSLCIYTSLVLVVSFNLLLSINSINYLDVFAFVFMSLGLYTTWMWISEEVITEINFSTTVSHQSSIFYFSVTLTTMFCSMGDYFFKSLRYQKWPTPSQYLRKVINSNSSEDIDQMKHMEKFYKICHA